MSLAVRRQEESLLTLPGCDQLESFLSTLRSDSVKYEPSAAMALTGTSPAINCTGTLVYPWDLWLKCTAGGVRGSSAVQFSLNGGSSYNGVDITTGATVTGALLTATGLTANLATGTYVLNDTWRLPYGTWNDVSPRARQYLTTGSGKNPVLDRTTGINGRPALVGDGVAQVLECTDSAYATALCGGLNTPCTIIWVGSLLGTLSAEHVFWGLSNSVSSTGGLSGISLSSQWCMDKRGDTGADVPASGGTTDHTAHVWAARQNGTTADMFLDGSQIITAAAQSVSSATMTKAQLFGFRGTANLYGNVALGSFAAYRGALPTNTIKIVSQWLKYLWGTP